MQPLSQFQWAEYNVQNYVIWYQITTVIEWTLLNGTSEKVIYQ